MRLGITTFGGDGGKSGISQYIISLLREFADLRAGEETDVMVFEDEVDIFVPEKSSITPVCFGDRIRPTIMNILWHQFELGRRCKQREYDMLFLPAANRRVPFKVPCPTVGTVHDFSSLHVKGKYDPARMFYIKTVLPALVRRLDRVLTVSESSKRDIVEYARVPPEKVFVTPLAADRHMFAPREQEEAAARVAGKYGIKPPYVIYVSRIEHPGKNHVRLIRAFERLKESESLPHQLVLAGSDWGRADEVHRVAAECSCASDIVFTGFAPNEDIPDLYCGAHAFVFPSLYEGFGLPVLEAMTAGVATACSNLSSMPEVAGNAALQFDPYDEEQITEALRALLTDSTVRTECQERGLARSREFTWRKTAERTLELIEQLGVPVVA